MKGVEKWHYAISFRGRTAHATWPLQRRADLRESDPAEMPGFKHLGLSFVAKQDVRLVEQRISVYGPEPVTQALVFDCFSVVRVMQMMIVYRRQAGRDDRTTFEGTCAFSASKQVDSRKRSTLDRELLVSFQSFPGEISRFGESSHDVGMLREMSNSGLELATKESRVSS